ncbi:MAG TPA: 50S ribosomal protein L11 methyltransferase [Rhodanobacteraceae bacterium]|jgi:ribosomal protein L11 methyltransferase|nr:50S ribosomal protein L11 methyltransferase [Rhodanobacteraceae bacterium]
MPWLELQLTVEAAQQPRAEAALEELGALSVTLMDADADTPDEAAIFEPGVGETPLWRSLTLLALFEAGADRRGLLHLLHDALPELAPDRVAFREVADQDWERAWMDRFQPMRFGRRLWIYPWNVEPPHDDRESIIMRLDPGLAFGTGTHPTTALCLEWLDGLDLAGKSIIDYGCGSGVLAIAALKLGAAHAIGVDNDPQALTATRDNAARNGVADRLQACLPGDLPPNVQADVFVANILAGPLGELAPLFALLCKPGAPFALSGILAGQESELLERYRDCGFADLRSAHRDDWIRIDGVRS